MTETRERPAPRAEAYAPEAGPAPASAIIAGTEDEPTLAALATRFVRRAVPYRLFQLTQLALPLAVDLALRGWGRGAAWACAVAAFGAWGLADRWLARRVALPAPEPPEAARSRKLVRVVRAVAGTLATALPAALLLELFLRLLGNAPIS